MFQPLHVRTYLHRRTAFHFAFLHFVIKILINCVTRNKVAPKEHFSSVKHNNVILGKI